MMSKVLIVFLGVSTLSVLASAYGVRSRHAYPQQRMEEKEVVETYSPAVKVVEEAPIRVSYEEEPVREMSRGYSSGTRASSYSKYDEEEELKLIEEQNKNAHYEFASAVDDGIMDQSHIRQEKREGAKVTGSYAYSDGYFKRTVHYEADDDGYRVVNEEVEPISETGPQIDLTHGKAEVRTQLHGVDTHYMVNAEELAQRRKENMKMMD